MKPKELVELGVAIVVLVVAGYFIVGILAPHKTSAKHQTTYEVVTPIPSGFDSSALSKLRDPSNARDFYTQPNLHNGIGNPHPFNAVQ